MQLHRNGELANRLQRLVQLNLAPVDVEALLLQSLSDVTARHRSEQLIVFSGLTSERNLEPLKLLGKRLGFRLLFGRPANGSRLHLLDHGLVGSVGLDGQLPRKQKIPTISFGDLEHIFLHYSDGRGQGVSKPQ